MGKGTPVNGDEVSTEETIAGLEISVGPLIVNLLGTQDGYEALGDIVKIYGDDLVNGVGKFYDDVGKEHGVLAEARAIILSTAAVSFAAPFVIKTGMVVAGTAWAINAISVLGDNLKQVSVEIYSKVKSFNSSVVGNIESFYNKNFNSGYRAASADPTIRVDTAKLRAHADRLEAVNKRLRNLDKRMDDLYLKVGLRDLFNLLQADLLTGSSWRISNCAKYLDETANDFDSTEHSVIGQF